MAQYGKESKEYQQAVEALAQNEKELEEAKANLTKETGDAEAAQKELDREKAELAQSKKDVATNEKELADAKEAYRVAAATCGKCEKDFTFNRRMKPMVQVLKQKGKEFYTQNESPLFI